MSFKSTSFVAAHYPNTYMEQFCKAMHPELELGTVCVAWFRQATKYCSEMLSGRRPRTTYFWNTVKNFIFPDRTTDIASQKIPINVHPNRLSMQDCQSLFFDMVRDYVQRAPRYAAESTTNVMLWQVLYSLMGIMALGSLLLGIIYAYNKYGQPQQVINLLEEVFNPEKRMNATAKRSLRLAKAELSYIRIKPIAMKEDILAPDGAEVLALKVGKKFDFLETVVEGSLVSEGKLCRLYDQYSRTKLDFKIEALNKAMKFLDNNCKKLHLLLMFEDDVPLEEVQKVKSPRIRSLSPPTFLSPRSSNLSPKRMLNTRIEGGGVTNKASGAGTGTGPSSTRPNSPKQTKTSTLTSASTSTSTTTPRSSGVASTGIPRNLSKRSSPLKKTKK